MATRGELDRFKRRLIRTVARYREDNVADLWDNVQKAMGKDCRTMWVRMRALTLKKLMRLRSCGDVPARLAPNARMNVTDWLLLDLVLVHEQIDTIDSTALEDLPQMVALFTLVQNYKLEGCPKQSLASNWATASMHYNQNGRQCSPMLLQRRWYEVKAATRHKFYHYWNVYKRQHEPKDKPTELNKAVATRYPHVVTAEFKTWQEMLKEGMIVLPHEFESVLKLVVLPKRNGDTEETDDVVLIEPVIETIDVDLVTELEKEVEHNLTDTSQNHLDCGDKARTSADKHTDICVSEQIESLHDSNNENKLMNCTEADAAVPMNDVTEDINIHHTVENIESIEAESSDLTVELNSEIIIKEETQEPDGLDNVPIVAENRRSTECIIKKESDIGILQNESESISVEDGVNGNNVTIPVILKVETIAVENVSKITEPETLSPADTSHNEMAHRPGPKSKKHLLSSTLVNGDLLSQENISTAPVSKRSNKPGPRCTKDASYTERESVLPCSSVDTKFESKSDDGNCEESTLEAADSSSDSKEDYLDLVNIQDTSNLSKGDKLDVQEGSLSGDEFDECNFEFAEEDDEIDLATLKSLELQHSISVKTDNGSLQDKNQDKSSIHPIASSPDSSEHGEYIRSSSEERSTPKFDLKLLMLPVVYTFKVDAMQILKDHNLTCTVVGDDIIDSIEAQSKPKGQEFNVQDGIDHSEINRDDDHDEYAGECLNTSYNNSDEDTIEEHEPNEPQIVKETSYLFQKPKTRIYTPINLCKNPDFNTRLRRLSVGFLMKTRNRQQLKACKPLTVDIHKTFEEKLVEGMLIIKCSEKKDEAQDTVVITDIDSQSATVTPSSMPAQSLFDKETVNMESLMSSSYKKPADIESLLTSSYNKTDNIVSPMTSSNEEKLDVQPIIRSLTPLCIPKEEIEIEVDEKVKDPANSSPVEKRNIELLRARQSKAIQLPDIEKVRLVNKQLLTAQVPPLQAEKKCEVVTNSDEPETNLPERTRGPESNIRVGLHGEIFQNILNKNACPKLLKKSTPKIKAMANNEQVPWYQRGRHIQPMPGASALLKIDSLQRMIHSLTPEATPHKPTLRKMSYCCTAKRHKMLNAARCRLLINTKGEVNRRRFQKELKIHSCKSYDTCKCCCKHLLNPLTPPPKPATPPPKTHSPAEQIDEGSELISALAGLETPRPPSPVKDLRPTVAVVPATVPIKVSFEKKVEAMKDPPVSLEADTKVISTVNEPADKTMEQNIIELDDSDVECNELPIGIKPMENRKQGKQEKDRVTLKAAKKSQSRNSSSDSVIELCEGETVPRKRGRLSKSGVFRKTRNTKRSAKFMKAIKEWESVKDASKTAFGFDPAKKTISAVMSRVESSISEEQIDMESECLRLPEGTRIMLLNDGQMFVTSADGIPLKLTASQHSVLRMMISADSGGLSVTSTADGTVFDNEKAESVEMRFAGTSAVVSTLEENSFSDGYKYDQTQTNIDNSENNSNIVKQMSKSETIPCDQTDVEEKSPKILTAETDQQYSQNKSNKKDQNDVQSVQEIYEHVQETKQAAEQTDSDANPTASSIGCELTENDDAPTQRETAKEIIDENMASISQDSEDCLMQIPENPEENKHKTPATTGFLSVKKFAKIPQQAEAPIEVIQDTEPIESTSNARSILSDLMEISGISAEDTATAPEVEELEQVDSPTVLQEWTNTGNSNSLVFTPVSPSNIANASLGGQFYMYDSKTGQMLPLNLVKNYPGLPSPVKSPAKIPIPRLMPIAKPRVLYSDKGKVKMKILKMYKSKNKLNVVHKLQNLLKDQTTKERNAETNKERKPKKQLRKAQLEALIDLVDSDAPMEEEYLVESQGSDIELNQSTKVHVSTKKRKRKWLPKNKVITIDSSDSSDDEPLSKIVAKKLQCTSNEKQESSFETSSKDTAIHADKNTESSIIEELTETTQNLESSDNVNVSINTENNSETEVETRSTQISNDLDNYATSLKFDVLERNVVNGAVNEDSVSSNSTLPILPSVSGDKCADEAKDSSDGQASDSDETDSQDSCILGI